MPNYQNGKIYKLESEGEEKIYIGSTTLLLCQRLAEHKRAYKRFINGDKTQSLTSKELIKNENCIITLIEDYPCERKEQLLSRERYWFNQFNCINKLRPLLTEEEKETYGHWEWVKSGEEGKKKHNEQQREIYHKNIELAREKNRNKQMTPQAIERRKEYYQKNKEEIKAKNKKYREDKINIQEQVNLP
jgi:hypothetical protein